MQSFLKVTFKIIRYLFWLMCRCWGPITRGGISGVIRIGRRGRSISCPLGRWSCSCGWGGLWWRGLVPLGGGCHGWTAILWWIGSAWWWKLWGPIIGWWDLVDYGLLGMVSVPILKGCSTRPCGLIRHWLLFFDCCSIDVKGSWLCSFNLNLQKIIFSAEIQIIEILLLVCSEPWQNDRLRLVL